MANSSINLPNINLTGDVTSSGNVTTISTDSITLNKLTTEVLGYFSSLNNPIINGEFNIWQRGTSFASIANATFTSDRWSYHKVGAMVHTVTQSSDVPTVAEAGRLYESSLKLDCTTVDTSLAAGDFCSFRQRIEGYNFLPFAQQDITLSFWVKSTKTGIFTIALSNTGGDRSIVKEYTINSTDTWEFKVINITASPSAGTWDYTTGVGLDLWFLICSGSTYQTTPDSWQTGIYLSTSNAVNGVDSIANDFYLTGVKIELGNFATPFRSRSYSHELMLCQRYYEVSGSNLAYFHGDVSNTGGGYAGVATYKVSKRVNPVVTTSNVTVHIGSFNTAAPTITNQGVNGFVGRKSCIATSGDRGFDFAWAANAEL